MPGVTLCKTRTVTQTQQKNIKTKSIDSSEMRGLMDCIGQSTKKTKQKIVQNSSSKQYNGPPKSML